MSEEETQETVKTFTQEDMDNAIEGRLARERTKTQEVISGLTARLDEMDAERAEAQAKSEADAKAKLSATEQVQALEARINQSDKEKAEQAEATRIMVINNKAKDLMVADGLDPEYSILALGELERMRTVTTDGILYKDVNGVALTELEALAKVKATYPKVFSANRPSGANLPTGQGGPEADRSNETIDQFRARREKEGHYK